MRLNLLLKLIILTSKKDLSSVFFGGPGAGEAGVTDTTSARSETFFLLLLVYFCFDPLLDEIIYIILKM